MFAGDLHARRRIALTTSHAPGTPRPSVAASLFLALRPAQWTKNLIVFAALIFGQRLLDGEAVARAAVAFVTFCALSGVVYITIPCSQVGRNEIDWSRRATLVLVHPARDAAARAIERFRYPASM